MKWFKVKFTTLQTDNHEKHWKKEHIDTEVCLDFITR